MIWMVSCSSSIISRVVNARPGAPGGWARAMNSPAVTRCSNSALIAPTVTSPIDRRSASGSNARSSTTASRSKLRSFANVTASCAVIRGTCRLEPRDAFLRGLDHVRGLMAEGLAPAPDADAASPRARRRSSPSRVVRGDLRRPGAALTVRWQLLLDLLAARTRGLQILRRVAANLRLAAVAALDLVAQGGEARRQLRAVHRRRVGLRLVEFARLERAGAPVVAFGHIEDHDVRVQLGRGVAVDGPRAVVFEGGGDPLPRRLGGMIAADARLDVRFHLVERHRDARPMRLAHAVIAADQGGQRHALRRRERRIPRRAVGHRRDGLAARVDVRPRCLVLDERLAGDRVLAVGEPCDVLLVHVTREAPPRRELPVPLAGIVSPTV